MAEATDDAFVEEQAEQSGNEDQTFDSLEDALDAFEDEAEPEGEPEPETEQEPEPDAEEDASVLVDLDGEKISLEELKAGYYRQKDYTHKTTEVAQERKALESTKAALNERTVVMETALQNLSGYLQRLIPPEPPLQLAQTDPGRYQYQQALRQAAIAELGELVSIKGEVDAHKATMSQAELREYREREQAALVKAMPALADPVKKVAFDQSIKATAKAFGFTDDEIDQTADNRILRLVHYAKIGKKAEENRTNALKRVETPKVAKAKAPVVPANNYNTAKRRFVQAPSIKSAAALDFD